MASDPVATDSDLRAWLVTRIGSAGRWPDLAWVMGMLVMLAAVGQAYCLAAFFPGWLFEHRSFAELLLWWLCLPGFVALRAVAGWAKEDAGIRASRLVRQSLRSDLVDRVGRLGPAWKITQASGALTSKLLEQVDGLDAYVARYLPQQKLAAGGPLLLLAIVFPLNWVCGLILLLTAPLIPLFMILIGKGAQVVQTRQLRSLSRMSGLFLDVLRGLTSLKLVDAHRRQSHKIAGASESFRTRTMEVLRLAFLSSTMLEFFSVLAIALTALYLGFTLLGQIDFGLALSFQTALFVLLLAPDFYQPLRDLGTLYHARAEALACASQLKPVFEAASGAPVGGTATGADRAPAVAVQNLHFAHREGIPVFQGFSLEVAAGESVAIRGPSGVGKTTLLRLLLAELAPAQGVILVDGVDLATMEPQRWKESVGWLGQHPRVVAASLGDNLRVARHDATDRDLQQALEFAGLDSWFQELGQGLETVLGEGGRSMSGGQIRRLGLARLWLRPARLLLLDEPTASLDDESQSQVLAGLARLKEGRTLILLTHHERPLGLVDRIVSLGADQ